MKKRYRLIILLLALSSLFPCYEEHFHFVARNKGYRYVCFAPSCRAPLQEIHFTLDPDDTLAAQRFISHLEKETFFRKHIGVPALFRELSKEQLTAFFLLCSEGLLHTILNEQEEKDSYQFLLEKFGEEVIGLFHENLRLTDQKFERFSLLKHRGIEQNGS